MARLKNSRASWKCSHINSTPPIEKGEISGYGLFILVLDENLCRLFCFFGRQYQTTRLSFSKHNQCYAYVTKCLTQRYLVILPMIKGLSKKRVDQFKEDFDKT